MADKSEENLKKEILAREESGKFNSLEKPSSAFSDSFTLGENPLQNIPAIIDKVIVDSKKQNSNQRESMVVDNRKVNYYESFLVSLAERDSRDLKSIKENDIVVSTRCAESIEKTTKSPFYFDKNASPEEAARRAFSLHIHPRQTISKTSEFDEIPSPGAIVDQTFKDKEKIKIVIDRVQKKGLNIGDNFKIEDADKNPQTSNFHSNPTPFAPPDGSSTLPFTQTTPDNSTPPSSNPDNESTDKTPSQKTWNPKYSPLGVGTTMYNKVRVTSNYGVRIHPITKVSKDHKGVDIVVGGMMPVVAIDSGIVSFIRSEKEEIEYRYKDKYGNGPAAGAMVSIKHKANEGGKTIVYYSQYMHLLKVVAKPGKVEAGQIIGFVGGGTYGWTSPSPLASNKKDSKMHCNWPGSGNSTGSHLHFAIKRKVDGKKEHVNPLSFKYPEQVVFPDEEIKAFIKENRKIVEANKEALINLHKIKNPNHEFIRKEKK